MKYRTTFKADQDIIDAYVTGADKFGIVQSEQYIAGLYDTFQLLADNPRMTRERYELNPPMRIHPYGAHLIAYTIRADDILIVRVLYGRQDWQSVLS